MEVLQPLSPFGNSFLDIFTVISFRHVFHNGFEYLATFSLKFYEFFLTYIDNSLFAFFECRCSPPTPYLVTELLYLFVAESLIEFLNFHRRSFSHLTHSSLHGIY